MGLELGERRSRRWRWQMVNEGSWGRCLLKREIGWLLLNVRVGFEERNVGKGKREAEEKKMRDRVSFFLDSQNSSPLLLIFKLASSASFSPSPRAPFPWRKPSTTRNPRHSHSLSKFTIISNLRTLKIPPTPSSIFRPNNLSTSPFIFDSHPLSDFIEANFTDNFHDLANLHTFSITHQIAAPSSPPVTERIFLPDPSWIDSLFTRNFLTEEEWVIEEIDSPSEKEIEERRKFHELRRRQVRAETEAWERMTEEYRQFERDMCEKKLAPTLPYVKKLISGWFQPLSEAIAQEQKVDKLRGKRKKLPEIGSLNADKMAIIVMYKIMGLLMVEKKPVKLAQAALQIGNGIEQEVRVQRFLVKKSKKTIENVMEDQRQIDLSQKIAKLRDRVKFLARRRRMREVQKIVKNEDCEPWSRVTQAKLGCRLVELLIETAYIQPPLDQSADTPPDIRPAFKHAMKILTPNPRKGVRKTYGVVECDPLVLAGLDGTAKHMVTPYVPMLVPPRKWKRYNKGGYLFLPSCVIRTHGSRVQEDAIKHTSAKQMQKVYKALDILGTTKWRVNKKVLSVVESIWDAGGNAAGLVDCEDVPIPKLDSEDLSEIKKWRWNVRKAKKINQERHALRCDIELKLSVARKLKDEEGFYYPHNIDFRGRAYPMHPHLNHLSSDLCRGVLEFAEGRPLGKSGLRWLKIQLANLYGGGVEKLSYEGRLAFVENHINDIVDSAENPLNGNRWWLTAEDPFQCLAACFNVLETLKSSSPQSVLSHLPIHQDGSCNGLQHYAALGRDPVQAAAVNLVAGEKPADVYSEIAARVHDIMRRDSEKDPAICPNALFAQILIGQVTRKLVKQTVMTSVYGVTFVGAREQIKRRLEETGQITDDSLLFSAACYAAKVTLTALGQLFREARATMKWLGDCAKVIAKVNQPVRWTTPLGLPVVQPYFKSKRRIVQTTLQKLALHFEGNYVVIKKQQSAFPPNFVHSLDGSHMMMTAIACRDAGLCFAGVHDSFWTHACDVDKMNEILRESFVELYSMPILENLLESFRTAYPELEFPPLPARGNFDLKEVLRSPYFFN